MDRKTIDTLQRVLAGRNLPPEAIRNDLLACLDLTLPDDADANELRFILERVDLPDALDELQRALSQIRARDPR